MSLEREERMDQNRGDISRRTLDASRESILLRV